jgi:site-specific recombinase
MAGLFALLFVDENDADWVEALDDELVERFAQALLVAPRMVRMVARKKAMASSACARRARRR